MLNTITRGLKKYRVLSQIYTKLRVENKSKQPNVFPDDLFLVSYPKSGNTWVRFFFANLLKQHSSEIINFHNVHDHCPEWESHSEYIRKLSSPRILKSHQKFHPSLPSRIQEAVQSSSFESMQSLEKRYGRKYSNAGAEVTFVRKGASGQWQQYFREAEWEIFKRKEGLQWLEKLGYHVD